MGKVYKVRTFVQHIATQDIFRVIRRRGHINTHYQLKLIYTKLNYGKDWQRNTDWLSEHNLDTYYRRMDTKTVKVLYGR